MREIAKMVSVGLTLIAASAACGLLAATMAAAIQNSLTQARELVPGSK